MDIKTNTRQCSNRSQNIPRDQGKTWNRYPLCWSMAWAWDSRQHELEHGTGGHLVNLWKVHSPWLLELLSVGVLPPGVLHWSLEGVWHQRLPDALTSSGGVASEGYIVWCYKEFRLPKFQLMLWSVSLYVPWESEATKGPKLLPRTISMR